MKKLLYGFHSSVGKSRGQISSFHRGGAAKKNLHFIDRFRGLFGVSAKVIKFSYDPLRRTRLALLLYTNGFVTYVPAVKNVNIGSYVVSVGANNASELFRPGTSCLLRDVKPGLRISNVELYPGFGAAIARAGGLFAILLRKYEKVALLKLSSGEFRFFSLSCRCAIGELLPPNISKAASKAGHNRWYGWRPVVRGRAMNPVDHPHGGRTNGGIVPTTPWARQVKGQKTSRSTSSLRLKKSRL
jgi:large subunit ribosomal protein L2